MACEKHTPPRLQTSSDLPPRPAGQALAVALHPPPARFRRRRRASCLRSSPDLLALKVKLGAECIFFDARKTVDAGTAAPHGEGSASRVRRAIMRALRASVEGAKDHGGRPPGESPPTDESISDAEE